jgi:hypothetical protein
VFAVLLSVGWKFVEMYKWMFAKTIGLAAHVLNEQAAYNACTGPAQGCLVCSE